MLNKIGGLARAIYIVLAIVTAFVPLGGFNVALTLVVLGLVAGLAIPPERLVLAMVAVIALPLIGTALAQIPTVGAQLHAVTTNLQLGVASAAATALAIFLYDRVIEGVTGLTGTGATSGTTAATAR